LFPADYRAVLASRRRLGHLENESLRFLARLNAGSQDNVRLSPAAPKGGQGAPPLRRVALAINRSLPARHRLTGRGAGRATGIFDSAQWSPSPRRFKFARQPAFGLLHRVCGDPFDQDAIALRTLERAHVIGTIWHDARQYHSCAAVFAHRLIYRICKMKMAHSCLPRGCKSNS
jgi:hypothetical protein